MLLCARALRHDANRRARRRYEEEWFNEGFIVDIEDLTKENSDFRRVLYTGGQIQLVLMALKPGEEIGEEVHKDRDQFFRIEKGKGEVWIDRKATKIKSDMAIIVPAVLAKLGLAPLMVRNKADEAVNKLPKAFGGADPRMNRELDNVVQNAQQYQKDLKDDFLSVEHLLLAMNSRLGIGSEELLVALKEVRKYFTIPSLLTDLLVLLSLLKHTDVALLNARGT